MVYKDSEKLNLTKKVYITPEVWSVLHKEYLRQRKNGRQVSKSKLVCNLILENYGDEKLRQMPIKIENS